MRAISMWEPWALLMLLPGGKCAETRSYKWSCYGDIVIHAAKHKDKECREFAETKTIRRILEASGYMSYDALPFGEALGIVHFYDVLTSEEAILDPRVTRLERFMGNYQPDRLVHFCSNIRRLPKPFPYKGQQNFFDIPIPSWRLQDMILVGRHF